jgi:hypothetical protein
VLTFSIGMKLALVTVNLVLGLTAIAVMLRTLRWKQVIAREDASLAERSRPR